MFNYNGELAAGYLEADLITDMFEASMIDMMNIQDIQDQYMTESVSDGTNKIKDFFNKIWEKIKSLFAKLKKTISDKIATAKLKETISKITKAGIKDSTRIAAKGSRTDKEIVKYVNDYMKATAKLLKKICCAKSTKEFNDIMYKIDKEQEMLDMKFNSQAPDSLFFGDLKYNLKSTALDDALDRIQQMREQMEHVVSDRFDELAEIEIGELKDNEVEEVIEEKKAVDQGAKKIGSVLSSMASKIGNVISKNKIASTVAISALKGAASFTGAVIGIKAAGKVINKVENRKVFENTVFDESVYDADDTIDSLMDDMLNNM